MAWEQDGAALAEGRGEAERRRFSVSPRGDLTISHLRLEDAGTYVCIVRTADQVFPLTFRSIITSTGSQAPLRSRPAQLTVRENLKWDPRPPVNQRLREGQNAQIACKAKGDKIPVVKWLKVSSISLDGAVQHRYVRRSSSPDPDS